MSGMSGEALVKQEAAGGITVLTMARPPINALNAALMTALLQGLAAANADPACRGVVIAAEGSNFSAGSDVTELGRVQGAGLPALCAAIDASDKPVVVAISGNALGGAMELVLAAHGRVAKSTARIGLPEVSLGLLPVAGATQRLPRLVGAQVALKILLDGLPLSAAEALAVGLLDAVVEDHPLDRARDLAARMAGAPVRRSADRRAGMRDAVAYQAAIAAARKKIDGWRLPAPGAIVDCVEAALLLPIEQGCAFETAQASDMAATPEAQGLRHAFLAERRALTLPAELAGVNLPKLAAVAVLGTSGPAPDVARMALAAGLKVTLIDKDRQALSAGLQKIAARQEALVADGLMSPAQRDADWARLSGVLAGDRVDACDLVLATPDGPRLADGLGPVIALGGKAPVVLHPGMGTGALSELSVEAKAPVPQQALGLAFGRRLGWKVMVQGPGASLDQRLRAVLSRAIAFLEGQGTERATIAATLAAYGLGAGARLKLPAEPIGSGDILGFCLAALTNEAARLVEEGAARRPSDVDAAALMSGLFPRWEGGPLYQADQRGLMALRADLRRRAEGAPKLFTPATILDRLISEGRRFGDLNR